MTLEVLQKNLRNICKLKRATKFPQDVEFFSLTATDNEISLVCEQSKAPTDGIVETGFRAMRIKGILDFSLTEYYSMDIRNTCSSWHKYFYRFDL